MNPFILMARLNERVADRVLPTAARVQAFIALIVIALAVSGAITAGLILVFLTLNHT